MFADGAQAEVVLAVDVRGETSTECSGHRARDDGRPPTIGQDSLPELAERDPRFASHNAREGIPFEDFIHPREVEYDAAAVHRSVIVTAPRPARGDGESFLLRETEGFVDLVRRLRTDEVGLRFEGVSEVFEG